MAPSSETGGNTCFLYAAVGFGAVPGLAYYDICTNTFLHYISFSSVTTSSGSNANDVTIIDEVAYVTDITGQQVSFENNN